MNVMKQKIRIVTLAVLSWMAVGIHAQAAINSFDNGGGDEGALSSESVMTWRAPVTKVLLLTPSEVSNIARVLTRHLTQRCDAEVVVSGAAPLTIQLGLRKGIGKEGFEISQTDDRIMVTGNDPLGLIAGVGKLLRSSRFDQGGFSAGSWEGISIPEKALRGIYWATHFRNTYDIGDMTLMSEYIEDMGLLGDALQLA